MKKILLIALLSLFCVTLRAETASNLVAQARISLANKDLTTANAQITAALALSPNSPDANALAAVLRLLLLSQQPGTQTFLDRLHISSEGRDLFNWMADFTRDTNGMILLPNDFDSAEFVAFVRTQILPAIGASAANLSKITSKSYVLSLTAAETGIDDVMVDYGDIQILRALLSAGEFFGNTLSAHNFSVQVGRLMDLHDAGSLSIETLLAAYPDLLTFADRSRLPVARTALQNAIARYNSGSAFIRTMRPHGVIRLINFEDADDLERDTNLRQAFSLISASLKGPVRVSPELPVTVNLGALFTGAKSLRSLLPQFEGNLYVANSLPDPTFGGLIRGLPRASLEETLRDKLGFVERPELVRPKVTIQLPAANARFTTAVIPVQGTATDASGVALVEYQVNGSAFLPASGTANWTANINLEPGVNVFRVRSVDNNGNESPLVSRTFILLSPLHLEIFGMGKVIGATNGQFFEVGKTVTLKAVPDKNFLFGSWSGDALSYNSTFKFVMLPDMELQALFVTNVFLAGKGVYNGLFTGFFTGATPTNSGLGTFTVTDRGVFSGRLLVGGKMLPFQGHFNAASEESRFAEIVTAKGKLHLNLNFSLNIISGFIEGPNFPSAYLRANQAGKFLPSAPFAGNYTWLVPGSEDAASSPAGYGAAMAKVNANGLTTLSGTLADGSTFNQTVNIATNGEIPLYASLYHGKGLLLGWLTFSTIPNGELQGDVNWVKSPVPGNFYPNGFREIQTILGAIYHAPGGSTNVLAWTDGTFTATQGNLADPLSAEVEVVNNKVTVIGLNDHQLAVTINKANGLFNGKFLHPATSKSVNFHGALLQPNWGGGSFLGTNQSGQVVLDE